jgi:hypothetical protein
MYSESLDHRLVFPFGGPPNVCAKYDIVSSVTFAELAHHGLARTMLEVANGQRK